MLPPLGRILATILTPCALLLGQAATAPPKVGRTLRPQQASAAAGEARVALVIGNGAYADSPLKNPVHDARAMAKMLGGCGFDVTKLEDASQQRMEEAIRAFRSKLGAGRGAGIFFFAGHGVSVGGRNYLLPVGQVFESESDVKFKATDAGYVLSAMEDAGARVSLMILDACRNNPFGARSLFRGAAKGLSGMEAPKGSFVAFATAPGSTAADGAGENGLFTGELIKSIQEMPNLEVEQLMKKVSARVQARSGGNQVPFRSSSLTGEFYFKPEPVAGNAAHSQPALTDAPAMAALVGGLQVGVNAPDAKVYVDGELKGRASPQQALAIRDLPVGSATLRVEAPGHQPREQPVEILQGQWTQAKLVLARTATPAPAQGPGPFALLGSCTYRGAGGTDLAVDPTTQRVYIAGGMGQQGLIRIDASNPDRMSQSTLAYGGGIAVDPTTGRYATTDGYGGTLFIFDPNDRPYDRAQLSGCGGSLDVDPASGRFFISTQCNDHVAVYSQTSKSLLANLPDQGVGSRVLFDPGSGRIFENLTPNHARGGATAPLVVDAATFGTSLPVTGFVQAVDGTLKRLYVTASNGDLSVLDSTTFAVLHTFRGLSHSAVIADTALGRFYVASGNSRAVGIYDAASFAQVATFTLPAIPSSLRMAPGDNRLYVIDGNQLYVLQR